MTDPYDSVSPTQILDLQPTTGQQVVRGQSFGLTKRELFAAMAMQGILSNSEVYQRLGLSPEMVANDAAINADALITRLNRQ